MFSLLIVDDEAVIREGLRDCVDWRSLGIKIVGEAADGDEALAKVKTLDPDIVLTDVVMPGTDGLELARILRRSRRDVEVVLFSAYREIKYIKGAFKYDAVDYLLKPFDNNELIEVMRKTVDRCHRKKAFRKRLQLLQAGISSNLTALRNDFYRDLLLGTIDMREDGQRRARSLKVRAKPNQAYCVMLILASIPQDAIADGLEQRILPWIDSVVRNYFDATTIQIGSGVFSVLVGFDRGATKCDQEIVETAVQLLRQSRQVFHVQITVGLGNKVEGIANVHLSYLQASAAIKRRKLSGFGGVFTFENGGVSFKTNKITDRVISIVQQRFDQQQTIRRLALELQISPNYLSSMFKKQTGLALGSYIRFVRIEHAKAMLKETQYRVREVSWRTGFPNSNYFSKAFRKHTGLSPLEFRNCQ
jgi:two-component system response regulator YesN